MCSTPKSSGMSKPRLKKLDEQFDYASHNQMLRDASELYERRQQELKEYRRVTRSKASSIDATSTVSLLTPGETRLIRSKQILMRIANRLIEYFGGAQWQKTHR